MLLKLFLPFSNNIPTKFTHKSALLNNNQATYVGTLKNIQSWIITHFNAKDANVESALASITTLLDNDIAPTLPTLAPSKQQLDLTRQQVTEQTAHVGGAQ